MAACGVRGNHDAALAAEGGRTDCRIAGRAGVSARTERLCLRGSRNPGGARPERRAQLTQQEFASRLGVPVETIRNWEQGKRAPRGPARALLAVIAHAPDTVFAALAKS